MLLWIKESHTAPTSTSSSTAVTAQLSGPTDWIPIWARTDDINARRTWRIQLPTLLIHRARASSWPLRLAVRLQTAMSALQCSSGTSAAEVS